ncbi:peptide chain release factor N(5)-glutamine methyltransferase [Acholeplasma sp. OttesenSCG-928-E16]|nr:peptide chain release factor N(5)-glutamine methyltransferase [Acholeplasma sp. OttesenSCG-928-E16]
MTYFELMLLAKSKCEQFQKEVEAVKFLLLEMSLLSNAEFYLRYKTEAPDELVIKYLEAVDDYLINDKPIQHILGYSYFYGRKFNINENAFIPRLETEELVENVLLVFDEYFKEKKDKTKVLDLGTGSGAISITLSLEEESLEVYASDISIKALEVAKKTAEDLNGNVKFINSDWFSNINDKFDIIVSNPPYIPNQEDLDPIVRKDPSLALFGGSDGLDFYQKILSEAKDYLNDYSLIAFEHGDKQADRIAFFANKYLKDPIIKTIKDMQGKNRITLIGLGGVLK